MPIQRPSIDPTETLSRRFNDKNSGNGNREACVILKVKGQQEGSEVHFRMKRSTELKKLMNAYCLRQGKKFVSFVLDGQLLRGDETPDELEVEEDDEITAIVHETFRDQVKEEIALAEEQWMEENQNALLCLLAKTYTMVRKRIAENQGLKEELRRRWNNGEEDDVFFQIGRLVFEVIKENGELKEECVRMFQQEDEDEDEDEEDEEYDVCDIEDLDVAKVEDMGRSVIELVGWEKLVGASVKKKLNLFSRL